MFQGGNSVLSPLLPDAMVHFLVNHGAERFAEIFLGEFDTPETIWSAEMRSAIYYSHGIFIDKIKLLLKNGIIFSKIGIMYIWFQVYVINLLVPENFVANIVLCVQEAFV
jgi:hypothetical protein